MGRNDPPTIDFWRDTPTTVKVVHVSLIFFAKMMNLQLPISVYRGVLVQSEKNIHSDRPWKIRVKGLSSFHQHFGSIVTSYKSTACFCFGPETLSSYCLCSYESTPARSSLLKMITIRAIGKHYFQTVGSDAYSNVIFPSISSTWPLFLVLFMAFIGAWSKCPVASESIPANVRIVALTLVADKQFNKLKIMVVFCFLFFGLFYPKHSAF